MTIEARYPGRCAECGGTFDKGERIAAIREREWAHESCPDDLTLPDETPASCPECFMVLPCICGYYESEKR